MTSPANERPTARPDDADAAVRQLERKIRRSRLVLLFEQAWRAMLWPFAVAGLFLLVSLLGLWSLLPVWGHKLALVVFAIVALVALAPLFRIQWPSRGDALRRLERLSGVAHRPASTLDDVLPDRASSMERALWSAHRRRVSRLVSKLRTKLPHPRLDRSDPYALRALLLLLLAVGLSASGSSSLDRLRAAFMFSPEAADLAFRLDAWVTPPLYTGQPPIVLADGTQFDSETGQSIRRITVPEKSLLLVRVNSSRTLRPELSMLDAAKGATSALEPASEDAGVSEYKVAITEPVGIEVRAPGHALSTWHFEVVKDMPPTAELAEQPSRTPRGALRLNYRVQDDYGVSHAEARFALAETGGDGDGQASSPLTEPPVVQLTLPRANAKIAEGRTYKDLTAHPWAGLAVRMTLIARDQAGQTGESTPVELVLPARKFTKPLAKAIVEQRRNLVRAPARRTKVAKALSALAIAPQHFSKDKFVYLGLRSAYWRLKHGKGRAAVASVVEQLWHLALRIEDGDLPEAERALQLAQEQLMRAIQENAPDAEIQRLINKLRSALSRFLQTLAERARRNGNMAMPEGFDSQRLLSAQDLEKMLKNIENLAKTGSRQMAQRLLNEMRELLERLQMGAMRRNPQTERMMGMVDGLGEIITRQQRLLDDTFQAEGQRRSGDGQSRPGQQGQNRQGEGQQGEGRSGQGQQGRRGGGRSQTGQPGRYGGLSKRQGDIRRTLDGLLEQLRRFGARPSDQLEGAGRAMTEAEKALNDNNLGRATQQQTLALDRLRQGTQSLAEQVLQTLSSRIGRGNQGAKDPFGRPERTRGPDLGTSVKVPDEIDIQRAREILEELRRRLSEPTRPMIELDYLERLLRKF